MATAVLPFNAFARTARELTGGPASGRGPDDDQGLRDFLGAAICGVLMGMMFSGIVGCGGAPSRPPVVSAPVSTVTTTTLMASPSPTPSSTPRPTPATPRPSPKPSESPSPKPPKPSPRPNPTPPSTPLPEPVPLPSPSSNPDGSHKVEICHKGKTLEVAWSGWENGHKKHGDKIGVCR